MAFKALVRIGLIGMSLLGSRADAFAHFVAGRWQDAGTSASVVRRASTGTSGSPGTTCSAATACT